jgi:hypothetical protein
MGLISLVLVLVVIGVVLYLIETFIPMDPTIKVIIRVVIVIAVCLWLLQLFVGDIPLRRLR